MIELTNLLKNNEDTFGEKIKAMERTTLVEHYIYVGDTKPIHQKPYRLLQTRKETLNEEVNNMLAGNNIEESVSPWSLPIVIAPEKNGSTRFCNGY